MPKRYLNNQNLDDEMLDSANDNEAQPDNLGRRNRQLRFLLAESVQSRHGSSIFKI